MKAIAPTFVIAVCSLVAFHSSQAQLSLGMSSNVTGFALFDGNTLGNTSLSDFEGKVVVVNYYTPW